MIIDSRTLNNKLCALVALIFTTQRKGAGHGTSEGMQLHAIIWSAPFHALLGVAACIQALSHDSGCVLGCVIKRSSALTL